MTVTPGKTWVAGEDITPAKLNQTAQPIVALGSNEVTNETIESLSFAKLLDGVLSNNKNLVLSGSTVRIVNANYVENVSGFILRGDGVIDVNPGAGRWRALIDSAGLKLDASGKLTLGTGETTITVSPSGDILLGTGGAVIGLLHNGRLYVGGASYASAIFTVDAAGNLTLKETAQSDHSISIDAIDPTVSRPVFTPNGGSFQDAMNISLNTPTKQARLYFTIDGTQPDINSIPYNGGPIHIVLSRTIKAVAYKLGEYSPVVSAVFTNNGAAVVSNPRFSPIPGTYTPASGYLDVTLMDDTPGANIRCTTDGAAPADAGARIIVAANASTPARGVVRLVAGVNTLKALGRKTGLNDSGVVAANYTISIGGAGNPPPPGGDGSGDNPPPGKNVP